MLQAIQLATRNAASNIASTNVATRNAAIDEAATNIARRNAAKSSCGKMCQKFTCIQKILQKCVFGGKAVVIDL